MPKNRDCAACTADNPTVAAPPNSDSSVAPPSAGGAATASAPDAKLAELEKQTKLLAQKSMQQSREFAAKQAELQKRQSEVDARHKEFEEWQRLKQDRKLNPLKYLQQEFGDDWYDKLTRLRTDGIPSADLIASELEDRTTKLREEMKAEADGLRKQLEERDKQEEARAREQYMANSIAEAKRNGDKYPWLRDLDQFQLIQNQIDAAYQDGKGEILTWQQAADRAEKFFADIYEKMAAAAGKRAPEQKPEPQKTDAKKFGTPKNPEQTRRSLSNDLTPSGTAPERSTPKDDNERMQRAIAKFKEIAASRANAVH